MNKSVERQYDLSVILSRSPSQASSLETPGNETISSVSYQENDIANS